MLDQKKRTLDGQVALVTGADEEIGRALALALSARGVCVVVMGSNEKALGNVVGEIANGGGKARHFAGDVRDPSQVGAALAKTTTTFGGLDIAAGAPCIFAAAAGVMRDFGRLLAVTSAADAGQVALVRTTAVDLAPRGITCNALCLDGLALQGAVAEPEEIAQIAVFLCSPSGALLTGQSLSIRGNVSPPGILR